MKKEIRTKYKALRDGLEYEAIQKNSQRVLEILTSTALWQGAQTLMCYVSFGNEIATRAIIERAWQDNKTVIIPVCQRKTVSILPSILESYSDLEPKTMGILEPKEDKLREVDPGIIELCLIPGIAFDLYGNRIGFGAGYYDRFLSLLHPSTAKVALAHHIQVSSTPLPSAQWDIAMDYLCTERGLFKVEDI